MINSLFICKFLSELFGYWLSVFGRRKIHQLSTANHQLFSKDGLNNNLTGIVPGEN